MMLRVLLSFCVIILCCNGAPTIPFDQITAIFPAEVYHLRVRTTEEQRLLIQKAIDDHPENEQEQWRMIRAKEPRLADISQSLRNFLHEKEERLSPPGRLLFNKLIDGIFIIRFGDPLEIKTYVYETLRLWYAMDLASKQNFAKILPRNAAALSNPNLVHYALADTPRSQ